MSATLSSAFLAKSFTGLGTQYELAPHSVHAQIILKNKIVVQ